jgi:hypothetical protein
MNVRGKIILFIPAILLIFCGCAFGPSKNKGVMSYRHGRVYLKKDDFYRVGILPSDWGRLGVRVRTISFYNAELRSSISTDAFCGGQVESKGIEVLEGDMLSGLENRRTMKDEKFTLDGRGAVREVMSGTIDGVESVVDIVVVRKSGCVFDFYLVTPGDATEAATSAFESFFNGFHYE